MYDIGDVNIKFYTEFRYLWFEYHLRSVQHKFFSGSQEFGKISDKVKSSSLQLIKQVNERWVLREIIYIMTYDKHSACRHLNLAKW